jgi:hypothetical protein
MNKIEKLAEELNAFKAEFQEKGKTVLKECFTEFFDKYPEIKAITWTQYTPYFNDGETCVFGVGDFWALTHKAYELYIDDRGYAEEFDISETDSKAMEKAYGQRYSWKLEPGQVPIYKYTDHSYNVDEVQQAVKQLRSIPEDIYEDLFGDHAEVVATKDGFEVEEYEHD